MKIESHSLSMRSEHARSATRSTTLERSFDTTFETLELEKESDRKRLIDEERQLVARLQYELLTLLLRMIGGQRRGQTQAWTPPQRSEPTSRSETVRIIERRTETERVEVAMQGCVRTDTAEIAINVNLSMSRTTYIEHAFSEAQFIDPLVISLDGSMPELQETTFAFDLDHDGDAEQISSLAEGCGFLALDRNGNGSVDSGAELFGATTGQGFVELSRYDCDGNDWIDENDPIFDRLQIWMQTETGRELVALGEQGIGAIYLGSAWSPFTYKSAENEALGRLRSTGIVLKENGSTGLIGQIDLATRHDSGERASLLKEILGKI